MNDLQKVRDILFGVDIALDTHGCPATADEVREVMEIIDRLLAESEPVAWISKNKKYVELSTKSTVYGSHTLPLYLRPTITKPASEPVDERAEFEKWAVNSGSWKDVFWIAWQARAALQESSK